MRFSLWFVCILLVAFASVLFFLGYDGAQIREYLLGVSAVILVATRLLPAPRETKTRIEKQDSADKQRQQRLSDQPVEAENAADENARSESRNPP